MHCSSEPEGRTFRIPVRPSRRPRSRKGVGRRPCRRTNKTIKPSCRKTRDIFQSSTFGLNTAAANACIIELSRIESSGCHTSASVGMGTELFLDPIRHFPHLGHHPIIGPRRLLLSTIFPGSSCSHAPHPLCGDDPKLPRRAAKKERSRRSDIRKINQKCRTAANRAKSVCLTVASRREERTKDPLALECFRHSFKPKSNLSVAPLLPSLATVALKIVASLSVSLSFPSATFIASTVCTSRRGAITGFLAGNDIFTSFAIQFIV